MKTARVIVSFGPKKDETGKTVMSFDVNGVWMEGGKAVGNLDPLQGLALVEKARQSILASVDMNPPTSIEIAPAQAMKVIDLAHSKVAN